MNFRRRPKHSSDVALDLTSLIDVIFILLIFFLVTASFTQTEDQSVPVDLPEGSSGGEIQAQEELTIFIESDGTVTLRIDDDVLGSGISEQDLASRLRAVHQDLGARPVFLRGDEMVRYGEVVRVLDACREAGFKQVFNIVRGRAQ